MAAVRPPPSDLVRRAEERLVARNLAGELEPLGEADTAPQEEQPDADAMRVGDVVGEWCLDQVLGRGGFGQVFAVHNVHLPEMRAAIKLLHPRHLDRAEVRRRFEQEAQALVELSGRHLVEIKTFGVHEDRPYLVMELLDGESLDARLMRHEPVDGDQLWSIASQLLEGLDRVHAAGIIHRDVKPENIFVCRVPKGRVKLLDFGLAKTARALTATRQQMGTRGYIAPEIGAGAPADVRSDVFSAAIVIYELLMGRRIAALWREDDGARPRIGAVPLDPGAEARLSPSLRTVLERGLALDPAQRFASIRELRDALEEALLPTSSRDPITEDDRAQMRSRNDGPEGDSARSPGGRRRVLAGLLVATALAAVGVGWPGAPPPIDAEGGILVTRSAWASPATRDAHGALCTALEGLAPQAVHCAALSLWSQTREPSALVEQTHAALLVHIDGDREVHLTPGGYDEMPLLSALPSLRSRINTPEVAAGIAPIVRSLAQLAAGADVDALVPAPAELVGFDWAVLQELVLVRLSDQQILEGDERELQMRRLVQLRNACSDTSELYCGLAHYLRTRAMRCSDPERSSGLLSLYDEAHPELVDSVLMSWVDCVDPFSADAVSAARLLDERRRALAPTPCGDLFLAQSAAELLGGRGPEGLEEPELMLYRWLQEPAPERRECPSAAVALDRGGRGLHFMFHEQWEEAEAVLDRAVELAPDEWPPLANWSETAVVMLYMPSHGPRHVELRQKIESRLYPALPLAQGGARAVAVAYLRWLATHERVDAERLERSYAAIAVGAEGLEPGLASSVEPLTCGDDDCPYRLLARPKTADGDARLAASIEAASRP